MNRVVPSSELCAFCAGGVLRVVICSASFTSYLKGIGQHPHQNQISLVNMHIKKVCYFSDVF